MKKRIFTLMAAFAMLTMILLCGCSGGSGSNTIQSAAKVPSVPTNVIATSGDGQATISFSPSSTDGSGSTTEYLVIAMPGNIIAIGTTSPIIITGLTNGSDYSFTVTARNTAGSSEASEASSIISIFKPFSTAGGLTWSVVKNSTDFFVAIEKNRSVYLAKYDAAGKKLLEKPLLEAVTINDAYYCAGLLLPTTDSVYMNALCVKKTEDLGPWFRTSGDGILLQIRKDDLTVTKTTALFSRGEFTGIESYPGDNFFYAVHTANNDGKQYLTKSDYAGNQLASRVLDFGAQSLQVGADAVFVGGDIMKPGTGSFNRLCVEKFSKDISNRLWETHYRDFDVSIHTDISMKQGLTLGSSGLFMTGTIGTADTIDGNQPVLMRWDPATGVISRITDLTFTIVSAGKTISDAAGNLYVDLGHFIAKIGPDGVIIKQSLKLPRLRVQDMLIDGTKLFVASTEPLLSEILIFDTETMQQLN